MIGMEFVKKKRTVKHSTKVNVWTCFSSQGFGGIVCFKQNFNAELIYDIYKRDTTWSQFNNLRTARDNNPKHMWKVALNWNASHRIQEIN